LIETGGGLLAVLVLVFVNGFFVAAEFALVTLRRTRVEQMVAEQRPGSGNVADATLHLDSYIAACQLGITMASLALGWVGEPALAGLVEPFIGELLGHAAAVAFAFTVITAVHVVAGELTPKGVALQYPEQTAIIVTAPLRLFRVAFRPIIWLLNESGWMTARILGVSRDVESHAHIGAEELRLVVQASAQAGAIETEEQFLLERVLRFGELTVASVMLPRTELVALPIDTSTAEATAVVAQHHHSRYPVDRKDIDDIIGVLHVRDLLLAEPSATLEPLLRDPLVVPSNAAVDRLLAEMRARRNHFAIAVDEFGGTDGIVTLEDVLESIVGELQDEFEEPERTPQRGPGGRMRIDGLDNVDVLPGLLGFEVEAGPYNTVAGYIIDRIGRMPEVGDEIEVPGYRLRVVEMDDLRIATVEAEPLTPVRPPQTATP
jgi:putative hemolysin